MPKTAQTLREKRPYIKKRLLTQDDADSKKEPTFALELDLLINKDINMESLTIKQYYNIKVQGIIQDLQKKTERANTKRREEIAKRKEADAKRKEAEQGLLTAVQKLYAQGMPVETIADTIARSAEFVQSILNKKSNSISFPLQ